MRPLIRLLRPHQWSKNLLVFVSILLGHQYTQAGLLSDTVLCFIAFCMAASAGYIVNDWLDVQDDRNHPQKCHRPLASGQIRIRTALAVAAVLMALALALAASINLWVLATVVVYVLATLSYSVWLKRKLLLDVVVLAGLYTVRIMAGVAVLQIPPSFWLLAFAMFLFFSLATLKRFIELREREEEHLASFSTRAWQPRDSMMAAGLGISSGMIAVLVLAFYMNSDQVQELYRYPPGLWLLCPLFLYWVGRIWLLANRSLVHGDPIMFAIRDRTSYLVAGAALCLLLLAK
jgi:4-hydroxybenzoate polyprenyltransferase